MSESPPEKPKRGPLFVVGWVLTILPSLMLLMSVFFKFKRPIPPEVSEGLAKLGLTEQLLTPLGILELTCVVLYLIPQTAVLGGILLAGYLGGAIATHVIANDLGSILTPAALGVVAWLGLYLRDPRIRALVPFRK
jgi:hypothetical protein